MSDIKNELLDVGDILHLSRTALVYEWINAHATDKYRNCIAAAIAEGITDSIVAVGDTGNEHLQQVYDLVSEARFYGIGAVYPLSLRYDAEEYETVMCDNLATFGAHNVGRESLSGIPARATEVSPIPYLTNILNAYKSAELDAAGTVAYSLLLLGYFVLNPDSPHGVPYVALLNSMGATHVVARVDAGVRLSLIDVFTSDRYASTRAADIGE